MTIEEKAKAYDEALKKIQPLYEQAKKDDNPIWSTYEYLFPELKEREESKDERIRKNLIRMVQNVRNDSTEEGYYDIPFDKYISYLEKQKECGEANFREGYLHGFEDAQKEQKSAEWSEEDETRLTNTLIMLKEYAIHHYSKDDVNKSVNWLENRVKSILPQPKQEWSEEDEHRCKDAIYFLETAKKHYAGTSEIELTIEWLKSLQPQARQEQKEQTTLEYLPKEKINDIMRKLTNFSFRKLIPYNSKEYKKIKEIRTNVRDLLDYPIEKKHWEPSEEQMEALSETIAFAPDTFKPRCTLVTLQDDLKKLMEE